MFLAGLQHCSKQTGKIIKYDYHSLNFNYTSIQSGAYKCKSG